MISHIIIFLAIIVGLILTKRYKFSGFVILVTLIGSDTDSAGLLYAISTYIPGYKIIIRGLVFIAFFIAVIKLWIMQFSNTVSKKYLFWYAYPLLLTAVIIFITSVIRGQGIIVSLSEIIWLGIPFFFIWGVGSLKYNNKKLFVVMVTLQSLITIVILTAGPLTASINGAKYAHIIGAGNWSLDPNIIINAGISFGDFNKQSISVFKFAQYHNPNALGFYSVVMITTALYLFIKRKGSKSFLSNKMLPLFLFCIGIIGWFNSLTRGPILMVGLVVFIYILSILIYPKTYKRISLVLICFTLIALATEPILKISEYLFVNKDNISILSRLDGYQFAINAIVGNPLWGVKPNISDPVPHILPLKIAAYYGIPAAILISMPLMHITLVNINRFMKHALNGTTENVMFPILLNSIILGALLTNGVIVYVLFWVILAEITNQAGIEIRNKAIDLQK